MQGIVDTQSFYDVEEFLDELEEDKDIKTLVIDSETKVYENIQETLLNEDEKRARRKGGNELDANISMRSWGKIKQLSKRLQNAKIRLATQGVNVVSVAQSADVMKDTGSNTRIKVGTRPDMQKKADYDYDLEIRLYVEDGKYMGEILKDRTHVTHQGDKIENPSYEMWASVLAENDGKEALNTSFVHQVEEGKDKYEEEQDLDEKTWQEKFGELLSKSTPEVKEAIQAKFKEAKIAGFDKLTPKKQEALEAIYKEFA